MFGSEWFEVDEEHFLLRGLTFIEFQTITSRKYNSSFLYAYDIALCGIVDVVAYDEGGFRVKYDPEAHFPNMFEAHFPTMEKCVEIILHRLTTLSDDEKDQIQGTIVFQIETQSRPEILNSWSCTSCVERKLCAMRKCSLLSERDVDLVMRFGYKPPQVYPGLTEADRWPKERKEIVESRDEYEDKAQQNKNAVEAARAARKAQGMKARIAKQKEERAAKVAKEMEEVYGEESSGSKASVKADDVVFKSPHFSYTRCPVSYANGTLRPMLAIASRSLGAEEMLVAGGLGAQPMKFVEVRSALQFFQHETIDKQRKIDEEKAKAKSKSKPRGKH